MDLSISKPIMATMPSVYTSTPKVNNSAPVKEISTDTNNSLGADKNVDMQKLTKELNQNANDANLNISFGYNKELNKTVITVVDKSSGEVITKLPSEDAMKFAQGMKELQGKLLDRKG